MSTFLKFIAKHLLIIHKGTLIAKAKSTLALSISVSPIAYIAEKITDWTFENQSYVMFVLGAIAIDHLLGSIIHAFIKKDFSFKKNVIGLVTKVGLVVLVGFLFEGVNSIVEQDSFVKNYTIIVLRLAVFLYPAGSAFMNSSIITNGKFPPIGWLDKMRKFQETLDISDLKKEKQEVYEENY